MSVRTSVQFADERRYGTIPSPLAVVDDIYPYLAVFAGTSAFAFLGFSSLLWMALYGLSLALLLLRFNQTVFVITGNLPLVLFPLICWLSALWSVVPSATISYSLMLSFTYLIAFQIGMSTGPKSLVHALTLVLVFVAIGSLLNLSGVFSDPWDHRQNLKGVFTSKNSLGHAMVLLVLAGLYYALRSGGAGVLTRVCWLAVVLVGLLLIVLADSAASLAAATLFGAALAGALVFFRRGASPLAILGLSLGLTSVVLFSVVVIQTSPSELFFNALSRDATMTGRTIIWDVGWNAYSERPAFGYGAAAFWNWARTANLVDILQSEYGEHMHGFHNLVVELLVMVGPVGLAAMIAGVLLTVARAVALLKTDAEFGFLLIAILGFLVTVSMVDIALYKEHALLTILPVALCVSLGQNALRDARVLL